MSGPHQPSRPERTAIELVDEFIAGESGTSVFRLLLSAIQSREMSCFALNTVDIRLDVEEGTAAIFDVLAADRSQILPLDVFRAIVSAELRKRAALGPDLRRQP